MWNRSKASPSNEVEPSAMTGILGWEESPLEQMYLSSRPGKASATEFNPTDLYFTKYFTTYLYFYWIASRRSIWLVWNGDQTREQYSENRRTSWKYYVLSGLSKIPSLDIMTINPKEKLPFLRIELRCLSGLTLNKYQPRVTPASVYLKIHSAPCHSQSTTEPRRPSHLEDLQSHDQNVLPCLFLGHLQKAKCLSV